MKTATYQLKWHLSFLHKIPTDPKGERPKGVELTEDFGQRRLTLVIKRDNPVHVAYLASLCALGVVI